MEPKELKPGDVLGRYQLLLPIAKGGMGQVWAARQSGTRGFQKLVAVKTILASEDDAGSLEEMLFEEASLASQVRHPNVVQTLDLGEQDATLYLVMEWVDGEPLDFILRTARTVGGIPIAIAVHLVIQACKGLYAAHEAKNSKGEPLGIVHRDISPQNLLVTYSGVVKLVDFGVAKATHQSSQPTVFGQVKGKFAYMAPEQINSQPIDARADIFAMGIVLYRVTTGKHPFKSESPAATIHNILMVDPARPSDFVPGYPAALEQVVMKALARDKDQRFASAHDMMVALEQALPTTLTAHAEKNTETFLRQLFEARIAERHQILQGALKKALGGSLTPPSGIGPLFPRSQSTMRAVSVEAGTDPITGTSAVAARLEEEVAALGRAKRRRGWLTVGLGAALAVAVGYNALQDRRTPEGRSAASNVPATSSVPAPTREESVAMDPVSAPPIDSPGSESGIAPIAADDRTTVDGGASIHKPPSTESPALAKKRQGVPRRDLPPSSPEATAAAVAAPRPAPTSESPPSDVDPLNRRR